MIRIVCIFLCFLIGLNNSYTQIFSVITEATAPNYGCIQLENPPVGDSICYKNEDLQVFLFPKNPDSPVPPIVGEWKREGNLLYFCPLIPFTKSLTYQARYPELPYFTFKPITKKDYQRTTITNIFPSVTELPENTLKLYLQFSAPMSEENGYAYINLTDDQGQTIEASFLDLKPLLWNEDHTRLTLWFDPGRVKRDLIKNKKMGAPLKEGQNYTLRISKNWKDANGYSLANDFVKKITVIQADRISPTTKHWQSIAPKANTKEPVIINFGEPLDHALASKSLTVYTKKGKRVPGIITLQNKDQTWVFTPSDKWQINPYRIQIKAALEDLAGNNFNRLFDTNLDKQSIPKQTIPYYYFDFRVK